MEIIKMDAGRRQTVKQAVHSPPTRQPSFRVLTKRHESATQRLKTTKVGFLPTLTTTFWRFYLDEDRS